MSFDPIEAMVEAANLAIDDAQARTDCSVFTDLLARKLLGSMRNNLDVPYSTPKMRIYEGESRWSPVEHVVELGVADLVEEVDCAGVYLVQGWNGAKGHSFWVAVPMAGSPVVLQGQPDWSDEPNIMMLRGPMDKVHRYAEHRIARLK